MRHLQRLGYRLLDRNWRIRRYELDIVAIRGSVVSFVEVKTRTRGAQLAVESVAPAQRRRIRRAAEAWIHAHPGVGREFRFDVVSVDLFPGRPPAVQLIAGAFVGDDLL